MNTELNNNDRKKHSKTIVMAGVGFLLLAAAFTFPLGNFGQKVATAQEEEQPSGPATTPTTVTGGLDTFAASGIITGTTQQGGGGGQQQGGQNQTQAGGQNQTQAGGQNQTQAGGQNQTQAGGQNQTQAGGQNQTQAAGTSSGSSLIGGDWTMDVNQGNVTNFRANFTTITLDAARSQAVEISSFNTGGTTFQLDPTGMSTINGTADVAVNGTVQWPGVDTTLTINKARILTIQPGEEAQQLFQGQPIYGIVMQLTANGTAIVQTTPPGQPAEQEEEADGGPLAPLTEPFQDLFGGGG